MAAPRAAAAGPGFEPPPRVRALRERLLTFMDEHVYTAEPLLEVRVACQGCSEFLRACMSRCAQNVGIQICSVNMPSNTMGNQDLQLRHSTELNMAGQTPYGEAIMLNRQRVDPEAEHKRCILPL